MVIPAQMFHPFLHLLTHSQQTPPQTQLESLDELSGMFLQCLFKHYQKMFLIQQLPMQFHNSIGIHPHSILMYLVTLQHTQKWHSCSQRHYFHSLNLGHFPTILSPTNAAILLFSTQCTTASILPIVFPAVSYATIQPSNCRWKRTGKLEALPKLSSVFFCPIISLHSLSAEQSEWDHHVQSTDCLFFIIESNTDTFLLDKLVSLCILYRRWRRIKEWKNRWTE